MMKNISMDRPVGTVHVCTRSPYHVDRGEAGRVLCQDEPPEAAVVSLPDAHAEAAAVVVEAADANPAHTAVMRADRLFV